MAAIVGYDLGGTAGHAGGPALMVYVGRSASAYPLGYMMDRMGRRPAVALSYMAGVVGAGLAVAATVTESYILFLVAALIFGAARGGADQSRFVAAEVHPEHQRARIIGLMVFSGTVGAVLGPLMVSVTGDLAKGAGFQELAGPWMAAAALSLISTLVIVGFVRPDPLQLVGRNGTSGAADSATDEEDETRTRTEIFGSAPVRLAMLSMVAGQIVMAMIMTIIPLHMDYLGQDIQVISYAMMAHTFGMFALSWMTGQLVDRFGQMVVIAGGAVMLITAGLLTTLAYELAVLMSAMFLLGLGWNFSFVAGSSLLVKGLAPRERGRTQGFSDALRSAAGAVGGLGSGFIFGLGGVELLGGLSLAISAGLALGVIWVAAIQRAPTAAGHQP